jgi:DNA (cytosine-5)-methyltransferase 1
VQNRSLTPREAARVQSFPDWFIFPEARTHSFRLIGNAVPPLIGEAVGLAVKRFLHPETRSPASSKAYAQTKPVFAVPATQAEAARWLDPLMRADRKTMRAMPTDTFLRGWHALLWLFPDLHPENALEHGEDKHDSPSPVPELASRYTRSGWPVVLEPLGLEAWRRFKADEFPDEAFYCVEAQRAGLINEHTAALSMSAH